MKIEEREQFVRPVKLQHTSLSYKEVLGELKSILLEQKDNDVREFKEFLEKSRYKNSDLLEQHPVTYLCELLRTILLEIQEEEEDLAVKRERIILINKTINHLKDIFIDVSFSRNNKIMYITFAYLLGILESVDIVD